MNCASFPHCTNKLSVHARRRHCHACRSGMGYHAKKRPRELLDYERKQQKLLYRVAHIAERKMDIQEAVSQKRRDVKVRKQSLFGKRSMTNGRGLRVH